MKYKFLTIAVLTFALNSFSQQKLEVEAKEYFWGENDKFKNVVQIPEKWKNESAVILYKNVNYDYHKFGKRVTYKTSIRKRIKLLDNAALEEFSEFSYEKRFRSSNGMFVLKRGSNIVGIKIIKPDGREIEIDIDNEAVQEDGKNKIAIANLEVGDIIDYYIYRVEPFKSVTAFGFKPVENTLSEEYPIVDFKLYLETENDFFINFNTYNGAPTLKELPTGKSNFRKYELIASDIDKSPNTRWYYPLVETPSYKFQVYFARSGAFENRAMAFLPEKENIIKTRVSKEEVLDLYDKRFKPNGDLDDVKKFLKENKFNSKEELVTAVYYYLRSNNLTRYIEALYLSEANVIDMSYMYSFYSGFFGSQKQFVRFFIEFLKKEDIDYEIIVAKKRYDGSLEELLIEKNVNVLLKINTEKPLYVAYFGPHTSINEFSPLLEGTKTYEMSASRTKLDKIKESSLPKSSHLENVSNQEVTVTIDGDFSGFSVSSKNSLKGHEKSDEQYELLSYLDYIKEDYNKYGTKGILGIDDSKKLKKRYGEKRDAFREKTLEKQKETFKKYTEEKFSFKEINDHDFEITNLGRFGFDSSFEFNESFNVENELIKKAGNNYIFEIGKLIGGQIELKEKERKRELNIYRDYPIALNYTIRLNIPDGYKLSGIDKLTKSIDNKTGSFTSSAKLEGDTLIVNASKVYKNNFEPKENWNLMTEFLDAASQFTNERVLLKKK